MDAPPSRQNQTKSPGPQNPVLLAEKRIGGHMLLNGVGNRHVKAVFLKGQGGGVRLQKLNLRRLSGGEADKHRVQIHAGNLGAGIPAAQRLGQRAGAAANFQNALGGADIESLLIGRPVFVGKPQPPGSVQGVNALHLVGPKCVHSLASSNRIKQSPFRQKIF